jgi:hypothetical protein
VDHTSTSCELQCTTSQTCSIPGGSCDPPVTTCETECYVYTYTTDECIAWDCGSAP